MKRRAGALLMALMLVTTSISPYAEELSVDTYSEASTEVTTEYVEETTPDPEEEPQAEETPAPEESTPSEETPSEEVYEEEPVAVEEPAAVEAEEAEVTEEKPKDSEQEEETEEETEEESETETEEESDPNADVETAADWEATLPKDLTGVWGEDIVKIAQSQLGYTESTRNFVKVEDASAEPGSETASKKKGYTRYGAWYGSPYDDWCAMFASFCLYYAGVPTSAMPRDSGVVSWIQSLKNYGLYADKSTTYHPVSGDLVFFAMSSQGADHVGIIESTVTATDENGKSYVTGIYTIEGNSGNAVRENYYDITDSRILGYGVLPGQSGVDEETSAEWEATLPDLKGDTASDVVAIAQSQIGYSESERNFTLLSDWNKNGYTRYGAWYGSPYEDWSAMFVSFCLNYADVSLPASSTAAGLLDAMTEAGIYENSADYLPSVGDVAFFTSDGNDASSVAVIEYVNTETSGDGEEEIVSFTVIEGDLNNSVRETAYGVDSLLGYGRIEDNEFGIAMLDETIVASGTSGDCTWTLDSEGLLTISGNGEMKSGASNSSAEWSDYQNDIYTVVIEEGVTNIGGYAFVNCVNLTSVTIPESVTVIGQRAFGNCSSLASIEIPTSVTSIDSYAFYNCTSLAEIEIPDSVTDIGNSNNGGYAFSGCTNLTTVVLPSGLTEIRAYLFDGCTSLTSVNIPEGVTSIGAYAFRNCTSLECIELPVGLKEIGNDAFYGCSMLSSLKGEEATENILPSGTSLGTYVFRDCSSLKNITLPDSITVIPTGTFYGCTALESVTTSATITAVNQYAFRDCSSLNSIFDLGSVSSMGTYAFYNCKYLSGEINLSSLDTIPNYAFYSCNRIESLVFSDSLQTIGDHAFWNCWLQGNETTITVEAGAAVISKSKSEEITITEEPKTYSGYTVTIPDSVTSIGAQAFEYSYVDIFEIGSGVSTLDGTSFAGYEVQAVIVDNNRNDVTVEKLDSLWAHLNKDIDTELVFRLGASEAVYLDGQNGDDDSGDGTKENPVKTFGKAKELAIDQDSTYINIIDTVEVSEEEEWDGSNGNLKLTVCRDEEFPDGDLIVVGDNGDLTFSNIKIDGKNIPSSYSLIKVNGTLTVTDGTKVCNYSYESSGTDSHNATAVSVHDGELIMTGGEISNNSSLHGGGVSLTEESSMTFSGGTISDNSASVGGGIYMVRATLVMTGGSVLNNTASQLGGGMYVGANSTAEISAGDISYNSQTNTDSSGFGGGGIYVESNNKSDANEPGKLYLYNTEITGNYFDRDSYGNGGYLGTISCCDTGNITVNVTKGAVIHDNSEAQTFYVYRSENSTGNFALPAIMLGGGAYNWKDNLTGEDLDLDELNNSGTVHVITNVSTSDGTVTGTDRCTVHIVGNSAAIRGSAIGTNGDVYIGQSDGDVSITIKKEWGTSDRTEIPESITVHVYAEDGGGNKTQIGSVKLTEDNNWEITITELPKYDSDGSEYTYSVEEDIEEAYQNGWISNVAGGKTSDQDDEASYVFSITNTRPKIAKEIAEDDYERKEESGEEMHEGEDTSSDGWGTWDDADNNQEVTYHLILTDIKNATNLTVHDYLEEGLDFEPDTIEIDLYDGGSDTVLKEGEDYTEHEGACTDPNGCAMEGCTFEVEFEDSVFEDISADAYLMITYKALTETHEEDYEDYVDEILNQSYMTYGISTYRSAIVTTVTDLFGFGVYKYADIEGTETALAGAEFVLERDGVYATFDIETDADTGEVYYMICGWVEDIELAAVLTSDADGMIRIEGLDDDTYIITETKAPEGYEIVDEAITVVIDEDGSVTVNGDTGSKEAVIGHVVNVENTPVPEAPVMEVPVTKVWDDSSNVDQLRPGSITVKLLASGEDAGEELTLSDSNNWKGTFTELPVYDADGNEIAYTVEEVSVEGYTSEITGDAENGYVITNTHTPVPEEATVSVTGGKTWDDEADADGIRPESIIIRVLANGEEIRSAEITEEDNWEWSFENLPKYDEDGKEIIYTITEDPVDGYDSTIDGFNVTNTHAPETPENPTKSVNVGNGTTVLVGDELTYTITYYNHHSDDETVTIVDMLDTGLEFVSASDNGTYDAATHTVTWVIENAPARTKGKVTVDVKVTDAALTNGSVENEATVQIGNDAAVSTNHVENPVTETGTIPGVKTGDNTPIGTAAAVMAAALAFLIAGFAYRKRRVSR